MRAVGRQVVPVDGARRGAHRDQGGLPVGPQVDVAQRVGVRRGRTRPDEVHRTADRLVDVARGVGVLGGERLDGVEQHPADVGRRTPELGVRERAAAREQGRLAAGPEVDVEVHVHVGRDHLVAGEEDGARAVRRDRPELRVAVWVGGLGAVETSNVWPPVRS